MMNRKKNFFLLLITIVSGFLSAQAQGSNNNIYKKEMQSLYAAIQKYFYDVPSGYYTQVASPEKFKHPYSFLWPVCALLQAANEMDKADRNGNYLQPLVNILADYRDPTPPTSGYAEYLWKFRAEVAKNTDDTCRYYDDNQWIGIMALDAFKRTKIKNYLALGREAYTFMMSGYDTVLGGGLYWVETSKATKNTCSNGPGVLVALQMYQATKNKKYLDTALLIYNWTAQKLQAPSGLFWDNISTKDGRISKAILSYNTGTMLQANVYLYECTRDKKYLKKATAIADSSLSFFYGNSKFRDGYWFNAVLLRGYQHLLQYNKDVKYVMGFKRALDHALQTEKNSRGLFTAKGKELDLVAHGGMLEILARFAWLESR